MIEKLNVIIGAVDTLFKRMALPVALLIGVHFLETSGRELEDISIFYDFLIVFPLVYIVLISISCFYELESIFIGFSKVIPLTVIVCLVLSIIYVLLAPDVGGLTNR